MEGTFLSELVKSLIVIGNGFDVASGLKSNFNDFFRTITTDLDSIHTFLEDGIKYDAEKNFNLYSKVATVRSTSQKDSLLTEKIIKALGGKKPLIGMNQYRSESYDSLNDISDSSNGFWVNYFDLQNEKPEYWYDVERMLGDFFKLKSMKVRTLTNFRTSKKSTANPMTQFEGVSDYIRIMRNVVNSVVKNNGSLYDLSDASQTDIVTQKLTYLLINVYGFNPKNGNLIDELSEFLLQQLKKFEQHFATYLTQQFENDSDYKKDATERLEKLSSHEPFNLLNFNYTVPQSDNLQFSRNIHSTLDRAPIFGIDSDDVEATEPYYKFTKTYRIMRLAGNTDTPQILPKSINKLIFYGHSLSQADYSYFQAIFDYYNIYSENIQLIFYYSPYGNKTPDEVARDQFDRVSRLLESYGDKIPNKGKNLLPKLLLEGRVKILELNMD